MKLDYGGSIIFMSKIDGRQEKKEAILGSGTILDTRDQIFQFIIFCRIERSSFDTSGSKEACFNGYYAAGRN